jgi:hypothetical protein
VRLTNKLNLPSSIYNAVARDPYSRGDAHISVTGLIGPARKRILELQHGDQLTEDVADRIWSLMGQITHGILERHDAEAWTEERLYIERHGWRISGQFDRVLLEQGLLQDYKLTSTYSVKDGVKPEYEAQANLYALMLREHGHEIRRAQIVAILRDYQKSKALHDMSYPQAPVVVMDVNLWPVDIVETYIQLRLKAHGDAQHMLPLCSPEERWERPSKFALVKEGNKKATSLHDTWSDAHAALVAIELQAKSSKPLPFRIDERPAEPIRCAQYCSARPVCTQADELMKVTRVNFAA